MRLAVANVLKILLCRYPIWRQNSLALVIFHKIILNDHIENLSGFAQSRSSFFVSTVLDVVLY